MRQSPINSLSANNSSGVWNIILGKQPGVINIISRKNKRRKPGCNGCLISVLQKAPALWCLVLHKTSIHYANRHGFSSCHHQVLIPPENQIGHAPLNVHCSFGCGQRIYRHICDGIQGLDCHYAGNFFRVQGFGLQSGIRHSSRSGGRYLLCPAHLRPSIQPASAHSSVPHPWRA